VADPAVRQVLPEDEPELPDFESMLKPSHFAQQDTGRWRSALAVARVGMVRKCAQKIKDHMDRG
jgi:hypothetical protein